MRRVLILAFGLLALSVAGMSQQQRQVLFVGNSYVYVNDLPQMLANVAESMGDEAVCESNTPGGCTFSQHCQNHSMDLIRQGGWDVVVLQEQSQYPSFPQWQVEQQVFPYAARLVDSAYAANPCVEPMFFMTWGRKNGDHDNAPMRAWSASVPHDTCRWGPTTTPRFVRWDVSGIVCVTPIPPSSSISRTRVTPRRQAPMPPPVPSM